MQIRLLPLMPILLLSACAYHSPYIDPTESETSEISGKDFSKAQQSRLIKEANELNNTNLYATTALAGTLGFGAYKVLTGGAEHQIAALATGSGAIYGYQQALYNETIASMLNNAAGVLACIDGAYSMPSDKIGREAMSKLYSEDVDTWALMRNSYLHTIDIINKSNSQYISNVKIVVTTVNSRRAALQLSPSQSYALITSSLAATKPAPAPAQQQLTDSVNNASTTNKQEGDALVQYVDLEKRGRIISLLNQLLSWKDDVEAAANNFNPQSIQSCKTSSTPPTIENTSPGDTIAIDVDEVRTFKITKSSGILNASSMPKDSSGNNFVETKIVSEDGKYFLEVKGKIATATSPVSVFVTDAGRDEATTTLIFTVK